MVTVKGGKEGGDTCFQKKKGGRGKGRGFQMWLRGIGGTPALPLRNGKNCPRRRSGWGKLNTGKHLGW